MKMFFPAAVVTAAALLLIAGQPPQRGRTPGRSGKGNVELKLKLPKTEYVLAEECEMTVSVTNRTAAPVEIPDPFHSTNWQPTYTINGPSFPQGYTFSFRSVAVKDTRPEPTDVPPVLVKLAPGETLEKDVPLQDWARVRNPGSYEISARLKWQGLDVRSAPVRFSVSAVKAVSMSVGVDLGVDGTAGEWVEWFHDESGKRRLYTALFKRPHVDVRGYEPFAISPLIEAGKDATDLLSPWTNYNRMSELHKWRVWREGTSLVAFAFGQERTQRVELGAVPRRILRPALMTASGELDVFLIGGDGTLTLVRFADFRGARPGRVMSRPPLPKGAYAGRALLGAKDERRVVFVAQDGDALTVHHLNAGGTAVARIPNARPIADTEPGAHIDAAGVTHAAIPFERADGTLAIADIRFEGTPEPKITELGKPEAKVRSVVAGYAVAGQGPMRREWAALLENGNAMYAAKASRKLPGAPALPLELVTLDAGTYLLTVGPQGIPTFTLLD